MVAMADDGAGPGLGGLFPLLTAHRHLQFYSPDFHTDPDTPARDNLEQCVAGIQGRGRGRGTKKVNSETQCDSCIVL